MKYENIVLITDVAEKRDYSIKSNNSEGNSNKTTNDIITALKSISKNVYHYDNMKKFKKDIFTIDSPIVISVKYGLANENNKGDIPYFCYKHNIKYIGADSFCHMLCNDKYLSKIYASKFDISSPKGTIIYSYEKEFILSQIQELHYPLIVKPNYGGGSNGIINKCFVNNNAELLKITKKLLKYQKQPIIIEEYCEGYELSVILVGNKNKISIFEEIQLKFDNKEYYTKELFSLENKKINSNCLKERVSILSLKNKAKIINLFKSFDKVEFMRFDCRINDHDMYMIELSPDCSLGQKSSVYEAFKYNNYSYSEMFEFLITNYLSD